MGPVFSIAWSSRLRGWILFVQRELLRCDAGAGSLAFRAAFGPL